MSWKSFTPICVAVCAFTACLAWTVKPEGAEGHRKARQLIVYYSLRRLDDAVIVLGDSLVEASTLPSIASDVVPVSFFTETVAVAPSR